MEKFLKIRWGILGTGLVARQFAKGLSFLPDAELFAVGSRTAASAEEFKRQFNVLHAYQSYAELVGDKEVDVVYIATPNHRHKDDCFLCLNAGKAVLCEKPFALNARQAYEIIALARQNRIFCMEAMWMRFMPLVRKALELVRSGVIGEVRMIAADFGIQANFNPLGRLFNVQLGGGALLDLGVYPLSLAFQILGAPSQITAQAFMGKTGVDEQSTVLLGYAQGCSAVLSASLRARLSNEAVIIGTKGKITICEPFYRPYRLSIINFSHDAPEVKLSFKAGNKLMKIIKRPSEIVQQAVEGNGYNYEASEVMECLRRKDLESKIMPLDESLKIIEIMDTVRFQWGLKYPCD
jgi:predicted dehydrogenase